MKDSNRRILIAITLAILVTILNIISVTTGASKFIYVQFEQKVLNNQTQPFPSQNYAQL